MITVNIETATVYALNEMKSHGASEKTILCYSSTGFGAYLRRFTQNGISTVSLKDIDTFSLEQRALFDENKISVWKWKLIRRGGEILKNYAKTGGIDVPDLRPWDKDHNRPSQSIWTDMPTQEQLSDPDNIFHLIWKTMRCLEESGLTQSTIRHYACEGFSVLLRLHYKHDTETYAEELIQKTVEEKHSAYEQGLTSRQSYQNLRKAAALLDQMHREGSIRLAYLPCWGCKKLSPAYDQLIDGFGKWALECCCLAETSITVGKSAVRQFLFVLESFNVLSIASIDGRIVNLAVTQMLQRYSGGLRSALFSVRLFLRYLYEKGHTNADYVCNMPEHMIQRKTYHEGFTQDEVNALLEQPDRNTSEGKRDYAIIVLALQTGLRACDIVRLKRQDINWHTREVNVVQHKTGRAIVIPLLPESGNAIADYLMTARKDDNFPYVFTCATGVLRQINSRSASAMVSRMMKRAGIPSGVSRRGFHSLRRTFGTNLLQKGTSMDTIVQLLGQWKPDSLASYLSIDQEGLKWCALDPIVGKESQDYEV